MPKSKIKASPKSAKEKVATVEPSTTKSAAAKRAIAKPATVKPATEKVDKAKPAKPLTAGPKAKLKAKLKAKGKAPEKPAKAKKVVKKAVKPLTAAQKQARRSAGARKAALARWSKERPLSQKALKQQLSRVPTSELTVEHYADRPKPELSWAAAILKRQASGQRQRQKAAEIMSRSGVPNSSGKLSSYWKNLTPEQRHELAQRAGRRRWEIWREERARLEGRSSSGSGK